MNLLLMMLKDVLQQEVLEYEALLDTSSQKKDVLIQNDVKKLDAIVADERIGVRKLGQLESKREELTRKISSEYGVRGEEVTLQDIIARTQGEVYKDLTALKAKLETVLLQLAQSNAQNKALIETHLKYNAFCMQLMTGQSGTGNTYSHSGQINDEKAGRHVLLDRKV